MHYSETPAYRKAFIQYLRRGTVIDVSTKAATQNRPSTHYIWRTRGDGNVRASHAENNGKVFTWDHPPETGHPGEDYGCRCWAEPIGGNTFIKQLIITHLTDNPTKWKWYDFVFHYYFGNHNSITLSQVGLMNDIIRLAFADGIEQVGERVERYIADKVRNNGAGLINDTFSNGYNFYDAAFVLRKSKVSGTYDIEVEKSDRYLTFHGTVTYDFEDYFQDPLDIMQVSTMLPTDIRAFIQKAAIAKNWDAQTLVRIYSEAEKIHPHSVAEFLRWISEPGGKPYSITGSWKTKIVGTVLDEKGY